MATSTRCGLVGLELRLPNDEIHVWDAELDVPPTVLGRLEAALSGDERTRADRFFFARDRNRFIAARAILKQLLGRYLGRGPEDFEFGYGPYGKPYLEAKQGLPPIRFNLSHSSGKAVFAFTSGSEVGVDLESVRADFARNEIAEAHFSQRELEELRRLSPSLKPEGFFLCWTRKEAYVKAQGAGLQIPLTSFSVSLTPGQPEELESTDRDRWKIRSFRPAPGYVGAVVAEGKDWNLQRWHWQFSG